MTEVAETVLDIRNLTVDLPPWADRPQAVFVDRFIFMKRAQRGGEYATPGLFSPRHSQSLL